MGDTGDYLNYLSQVLWYFQQTGTLCDVVLKVEGQEVKAHKVILAASSQHFKHALSSLAHDNCQLSVDRVSTEILLDLLQFLYTGILTLDEANVHKILQGAQHLQIENAEKLGKTFQEGLEGLKERHQIIREVRGKGLMIGVELKFEVKDILMDGIKNGVLLLYSGRNILRLLPPLVITEEDVTKVLETLDLLLTKEEERKNV